MSATPRLTYYDTVCGFAILLVVLGHCIQSLSMGWQENSLELVIYSFHMPLFMIISGKFFLPSVNKVSCVEYLKNRFVRLVIPSLTWGVFNVLLISAGKMMKHNMLQPLEALNIVCIGMWFLTVLFLLSAAGALIENYLSRLRYLAWGIIWLLLYVSPIFWMRNEMLFLLPYFVGAIACSQLQWDKCPWWVGVVSFAVFAVCVHHYTFNDTMYEMMAFDNTTHYHLQSLFRFVTGLSGSVTILSLLRYANRLKHVNSWLVSIGTLTLPIYVLHQKFFIPTLIHPVDINIFIIIAMTPVLILLSIAVYRILRKSSILALMLFGEARSNQPCCQR